jgi:hypothetical protein
MQGLNDPNRELLDAGAFCRQLVDEGSVYAFLADHRTDVFPDNMFEDLTCSRICFRRPGAGRRYRRG